MSETAKSLTVIFALIFLVTAEPCGQPTRSSEGDRSDRTQTVSAFESSLQHGVGDAGISATPAAMSRMKFAGSMGPGVTIPQELESLIRELAQLYLDRSGKALHITSGYRSPHRQARAMYKNLVTYGVTHVIKIYKGSPAAVKVIEAFSRNRGDGEKAVAAMTKVIEAQIKRGIYVSDHLLGRAIDVRRSGADLPVLREIVRSMGGRVGIEPDHYHVEF